MRDKFLKALWGASEGYVFVNRGIGGHWNDKGRWEFQTGGWREKSFEYPREFATAVECVDTAESRGEDIYFCPYVMKESRRSKGGSADRRWVHADLDGQSSLLSVDLKALVVASGSAGHTHIYVSLKESVNVETHARLLRKLRDVFGSDHKISDNDVLRVVGTTNRKTGEKVELVNVKGDSWEVGELESLMDKIIKVRSTKRSKDRSADVFNWTKAGLKEGLSKGTIRRIIESDDELKQRLAEAEGDFERVCKKLESGDDKNETEPGEEFFAGKSFLTDTFCTALLDMGPIAFGVDRSLWVYERGVWNRDPEGSGVVSRRCTQLLVNRYSKSHESNARAYLTPNLPVIACEPVKEYINFRNGMLNWRTGELESHNPDFMSTVQLQVDYVKGAKTEWADDFVESIMHPDAVKLWWQVMGYMLMNGNPLQKAILCLGEGSNGKGVTQRLIQKIAGKKHISNVTLDSIMENRFSSSELFGKLANIAGDIDSTYQSKTAKFKSITGDDEISAERKFKDAFNFTSWAVPMFSANEQFGSSDATHGYIRRWTIMEYPNQFDATSDPGLEERLAEELEGIAAKAVSMLPEIMSKKAFDNPNSAIEAQKAFVSKIDPVARWLDNNCADDRKLANKSTDAAFVGTESAKQTLYDNYKSWCENELAKPIGRYKFYKKLEDTFGYEPMEVGRDKRKIFRGLRVR